MENSWILLDLFADFNFYIQTKLLQYMDMWHQSSASVVFLPPLVNIHSKILVSLQVVEQEALSL